MSKRTLIILGVIFGCFLLLVVGVVGAGYWALGVLKEQVTTALNANPVIQQHIGDVSELKIDVTASNETGGDNTLVFVVTGAKGSGTVTAELNTSDADGEKFKSGTLKMSSGETHDLISP